MDICHKVEENIRTVIDNDIFELLKKFIDKKSEEYYGEIYIGKVIDNNDPEKIGRCKIRVYGLFDDTISDNDLPWAIPEFSFIGSQVGSFIVPPKGNLVTVYFSHGDIYTPVYTTKVINKNKLPTNKNVNYPNNLIFFETDNGDWFQINTETKETQYKSSQGVLINIDSVGNVEVNTMNCIPTGGKVTVNAPQVEIPHLVAGSVIPNPTGGPFCGLPNCLLTGAPHQGTLLTNT